jgi:ribonuclease Z
MEVTLLGTSSMIPTAERNHSGSLLSYKNEKILVDCGEGIQRQFRKAKISPTKITRILITHWHGDHVLGLPGLMLTLAANNYNKTLQIYGPKGTKNNIKKMFDFFILRNIVKYKITEVEEGTFFEDDIFILEVLPLEHGVKTLAYAFTEKDRRKINMDYLRKKDVTAGPVIKDLQKGKDIIVNGNKIKAKDATTLVKGKKVAFVSDTRKCPNAVKIAKNADILICESTYLHELKEQAKERGHMSAKEAAQVAKQAKVKKLILTHFSQRYKNVKVLEDEARVTFKNVIAGKDLMEIVL